MSVKECEDGDRVEPGRIIVAAGDYHMTVEEDKRGFFVRSRKGEKVSGHCPSVDVLFNSVADVVGSSAVGVILTGMGADGAKGLLKMRKAGCYTIGQDRDSCIVYGMPMVSFNIGAVEKQIHLDQIGPELVDILKLVPEMRLLKGSNHKQAINEPANFVETVSRQNLPEFFLSFHFILLILKR